MISIEDFAIFAKKKAFVYPSTEIYGGTAGFFEYGPLGVELKNNIKQNWWQTFVKNREDVVGIDGSIISSGKIWEASGHMNSFFDMLTECSKCKKNHRADHLIEDALKISVEGLDSEALDKIIKDNKLKCPICQSELNEIKKFNLMFPITLGADSKTEQQAFLRGETAQLIFVAFRNVIDTNRLKLPFGIAQIGKAFRNEISPRNFLFRTREFEQMELEFFINPDEKKCLLLEKKHLDLEFLFLSEENQDTKKKQEKIVMKDLIKKKVLGEWHAYWLAESYQWYINLGINPKNLRVRQHVKSELSHYSTATFDIDYNFPFGWKEIHGNANRGQYDLNQHQKESGKSMEIFDEETKSKYLPRVIEPSFGVDRAFLAVLYDAYSTRKDEKDNEVILLKLNAKISPYQVAVFPLVNKLNDKAREVFDELKTCFTITYDKGGSIGRRYARADEQGIPYCITIDFDTIEKDDSVTIRNRDDAKQKRVKISELKNELFKIIMSGKF